MYVYPMTYRVSKLFCLTLPNAKPFRRALLLGNIPDATSICLEVLKIVFRSLFSA
jgi:hypothetical protein